MGAASPILFPNLLTSSGGSSGTANTGTAAASLLPTKSLFTLPAGYFTPNVLNGFKIEARGVMNTIVTTPGTTTFTVKFGAVTVFTSGAFNLNIVAKTGVAWWLDINLEILTLGSGTAATLWGLANFRSEAVVGSPLPTVGGNGNLNLPTTGPVAGTGFDSTVSQLVDLQAQNSVAGSITCRLYKLWATP